MSEHKEASGEPQAGDMVAELAIDCERGRDDPRDVQYPSGAIYAAMNVARLWHWLLTPSHTLHSIPIAERYCVIFQIHPHFGDAVSLHRMLEAVVRSSATVIGG